MKSIFITLILAFFTLLSASAVIGNVEKVDGSVKVKNEGSIKKSKVKVGQKIKEGDLVTTSKKGKTVIKLVDGSSVILDISSSVHFAANNEINQKGGKIFYNITSRDAKNSLKVKTPFAIIGIKGTTFVVNANEGKQSVALKEGKIGVASITEEFNLYRKEVLAQYNAYVNEQMAGFDKFRGIEKPKPEVTKEFDLEAGNVISFEGNTVKESAWSDSDDSEFGDFESMVGGSSASAAPPAKMSDTVKGADDMFGDDVKSKAKDSELMDDIDKSMDF